MRKQLRPRKQHSYFFPMPDMTLENVSGVVVGVWEVTSDWLPSTAGQPLGRHRRTIRAVLATGEIYTGYGEDTPGVMFRGRLVHGR